MITTEGALRRNRVRTGLSIALCWTVADIICRLSAVLMMRSLVRVVNLSGGPLKTVLARAVLWAYSKG